MNKIKSGFYGFVVLAVALAAGFYLFDPTKTGKNNDADLLLKVSWLPVQRMEPVDIVYGAGGKPVYHGKFNESPWAEQRFAPTGTIVTLMAVQQGLGGRLECTIISRGQTYGPNPAQPSPNGTSTCFVQVTA